MLVNGCVIWVAGIDIAYALSGYNDSFIKFGDFPLLMRLANLQILFGKEKQYSKKEEKTRTLHRRKFHKNFV